MFVCYAFQWFYITLEIMITGKWTGENYLECYRSAPQHKTYSKAHTFCEDSERVDKLNRLKRHWAKTELGLSEILHGSGAKAVQRRTSLEAYISRLRYDLFEG